MASSLPGPFRTPGFISNRPFCEGIMLGYQKVRNYDGSWTEYGSIVGAPIEVGG